MVSERPSQEGKLSPGAPNDPVNFGGSQSCAGVPLAVGGSCKFTYTFTPKSLGAHSSTTTIGINAVAAVLLYLLVARVEEPTPERRTTGSNGAA